MWRYAHDMFEAANVTNAIWAMDYSAATSLPLGEDPAIFSALWPDHPGEEGKYVDWLFWNIFVRGAKRLESTERTSAPSLRLTFGPICCAQTYGDQRGWSFDKFLGRGYDLFTNISGVPQVFDGTAYTVDYMAYPCLSCCAL